MKRRTESLYELATHYFSLCAEFVRSMLVRLLNSKAPVKADLQKTLSKLALRKNFANSKSGATVIKATKGILNKGAILDQNTETYLILPDCSSST